MRVGNADVYFLPLKAPAIQKKNTTINAPMISGTTPNHAADRWVLLNALLCRISMMRHLMLNTSTATPKITCTMLTFSCQRMEAGKNFGANTITAIVPQISPAQSGNCSGDQPRKNSHTTSARPARSRKKTKKA